MFSILPPREQLPLKLRAIYEKYGYKKYSMDKFEPYDMYRENKSFLKYDGIISFTNPNGRLMALKPDVTMSIVKNTADNEESSKMYYNENVFRLLPGKNEFSEISQMGLEFIGGDDNYSQAEVVLLALRSLAAINGDYVLNVSHMGFIAALFDYAGVNNSNRIECLTLINQKNLHGISEFAEKYSLETEQAEVLKAVINISGNFKDGLKKLSELAFNKNMSDAVTELKELYETINQTDDNLQKKFQLDFSVINDTDYYNGIVFQGYIPSTPRAVLSGGRYDNLMRRFGKQKNAIGFALYLGELDRALYKPLEYDTDLLLIYGDASAKQVIKAVKMLKADYKSIRAEKVIPEGIRAKKTINISELGENKNA